MHVRFYTFSVSGPSLVMTGKEVEPYSCHLIWASILRPKPVPHPEVPRGSSVSQPINSISTRKPMRQIFHQVFCTDSLSLVGCYPTHAMRKRAASPDRAGGFFYFFLSFLLFKQMKINVHALPGSFKLPQAFPVSSPSLPISLPASLAFPSSLLGSQLRNLRPKYNFL